MEVKRETYLSKLRSVKDKNLIKVVTGIRRCGKSFLLKQFRSEVISNGTPETNTQYLNFEDAENGAYTKAWQEILQDILQNLAEDMNYIFLDEVQNIPEWEKLVDSLYVKENVDLYITGSNAYFLSSEIATLLSGRQFEIKMLPFSYREFLESAYNPGEAPAGLALARYLRYGGMPQAVDFGEDYSLATEYLTGVYNTVVMRDVMNRQNINDSEILNRVVTYVFDNIGNTFSSKKVADYLTSNFRAVSSQTIDKYLTAMTDSFVFYQAQRFNIRGKELLKTNRKYYAVDMGFRNVLLARGESFDIGRAIENTVYLELLRRGYQVYIGQTKNDREVDFVAKDNSGTITYFQVCETMRGKETRERELASLRDIDDSYRKIILCLDPEDNNFEGIEQINLEKWLVEE